MKEAQPISPEILNSAIRRTLLIEAQNQPKLPNDIDAVWVFAGPGNYFIPLKKGEQPWQIFMDRDRIHTSLRLYRALAAKRIANRSDQQIPPSTLSLEELTRLGPYFIYNGNPEENGAFQEAFAKGLLKLPYEKVIILDEVESPNGNHPIATTVDQIASFYQELARVDSPLRRCHRVALVSHSPHFVRIPHYIRQFEEEFLRQHGRLVNYFVFGVKSNQVVFNQFVREELEKLTAYISCGRLNPVPTPRLTIV